MAKKSVWVASIGLCTIALIGAAILFGSAQRGHPAADQVTPSPTMVAVAPTRTLVPTAQPSTPSAAPTAEPPYATPPPLPDVPVDSSLEAVSASNPTPAAASAMKACRRSGMTIAGMAHLASARDARKYMRTNGNEPELQGVVPVWMVQLEGLYDFRGNQAFNTVCVIRDDGERYMFAPYGGPNHRPQFDWPGPVAALPPLAP